MNPSLHVLWALLRCELQLRSRRPATLVVVLAVLAVTWLMLADPAGGHALMVVDDTRLRYSSATLAYGSAAMGAMLLSLAGFYLARGRVQEDLRCGVGGLLAATPVGSGTLLLGRWLGALSYLLLLAGAQLLGTWALHLLRGEGPLQPLIYLQTYTLMLLPALLVASAFALLADAWAPLMGRKGDVAYFFLWVLMLAMLPAHEPKPGDALTPALMLDVTGLASSVTQLTQLLGSASLSIGGGDFEAALGTREFPPGLWTAELVGLRAAAGLLALWPLAMAWLLFHRYAPDTVKARGTGASRLAGLAHLGSRGFAPLSRGLAQRLMPLAARLPAGAGAVLAELVLSLSTQPLALLWLLAAWIAPLAAAPSERWGWQAGIALGWGLWASELGARDAQANTAVLGAALPGGAPRRHLSRWLAAWLLGLLGNATLIAQLPAQAAATLATGLALLAGAALLLGRLTQGGRAFLALFMFWMLVAVQVRTEPWLDWLGFNAQAGGAQLLVGGAVGAALLGLGWLASRR